jgi:dolichol-phosphate mannosyltransferase
MSEKLSVIIPAYNEEKTIVRCIAELRSVLAGRYGIPYELIIVNDNSQDGTEELVRGEMRDDPTIRLVNRRPPGGFGRAVRSGLAEITGDVAVIYMADLSDDPEDVVTYYRKILEGYDCVFGSRFTKGSVVKHYPKVKLVVNRIVNRCVQLMFWTRFNDLTNAFKAYRTEVIRDCGPYRASHFNLTLEMSLGALIRNYNITQVPISWHGRTWGSSNLRMVEMGRRYLSTLLRMFFERYLVADDLIAERLVGRSERYRYLDDLNRRLLIVEQRLGISGEDGAVVAAEDGGPPAATDIVARRVQAPATHPDASDPAPAVSQARNGDGGL